MTKLTIFDVYDYNPNTGVFLKYGKPTGWKNKNGYIYISLPTELGLKKVLAHRLAWFMTYGEWPCADVDHKDRDRSNNRISNLRLLTRSSNLLNMDEPLLKGIYWDKSRLKWKTRLGRGGSTERFNCFGLAYKRRKELYAKSIEEEAIVLIELERDRFAEDLDERNTAYLTVSKNRPFGSTGPAGALSYNPETTILSEKLGPQEPKVERRDYF